MKFLLIFFYFQLISCCIPHLLTALTSAPLSISSRATVSFSVCNKQTQIVWLIQNFCPNIFKSSNECLRLWTALSNAVFKLNSPILGSAPFSIRNTAASSPAKQRNAITICTMYTLIFVLKKQERITLSYNYVQCGLIICIDIIDISTFVNEQLQ